MIFIWLQHPQLTDPLHANPNQLTAFYLTNSIDPLSCCYCLLRYLLYIELSYNNLQTVKFASKIYARLIEQSENEKEKSTIEESRTKKLR